MANLNPYSRFTPTEDTSQLNSNSPPKTSPYIIQKPTYGTPHQYTDLITSDVQDLQKMFESDAQDLKNRYQNIIDRYTRLGKTFQDLEGAVEEERKKTAVITDNFNNLVRETENDRKIRAAMERDLLGFRDELKRKDLMISEYEKQIAKLQQQNNQLAAENGGYRTELQRANDLFRVKLKEIEDAYNQQLRELKARNDALIAELERQKGEFINQLNQLNNEWNDKTRGLQNQLFEKDQIIQDLNNKLLALAQENEKLKNDYKANLAREVNVAKKEEEQKWETILDEVKNQWSKALGDERYFWENKTQENDRELAARTKQLQDLKQDYDRDVGGLQHELINFQNQFNALRAENERLKKELQAKDATLARYEQELQALRAQLDKMKDILNDRKRLEDAYRALQQQLADRERQLASQEQELNKFRGVFGGLKDQLLGNIGKVIHETVDKHQK